MTISRYPGLTGGAAAGSNGSNVLREIQAAATVPAIGMFLWINRLSLRIGRSTGDFVVTLAKLEQALLQPEVGPHLQPHSHSQRTHALSLFEKEGGGEVARRAALLGCVIRLADSVLACALLCRRTR